MERLAHHSRLTIAALAAFITLALAAQAHAQAPSSTDEADKLIAKAVESPEETAKLFITATIMFSEGDKGVADHILVSLSDDLASDWKEQPSSRTFLERVRDKGYIFRSYVKGATPENGYKADLGNIELNIEKAGDDKYSDQYVIRLTSAGAASARPLYLKKGEDGKWQVSKFSSIFSDVKKPEK